VQGEEKYRQWTGDEKKRDRGRAMEGGEERR